MKRWVLVDFDSCPRCGDDAEILTDSEINNQFYEDDEVRCCQSEICDASGSVVSDDGRAEISWYEDNE